MTLNDYLALSHYAQREESCSKKCMRIKILLFVTTSIIICNLGFTQVEIKGNILAQARLATKAAIDGDLNTMLEYTPANVVSYLGGKKLFFEHASKLYQEFEKKDIKIISVQVIDSIIFEKQDFGYHAMVPKILTLEREGKTYVSHSYYFGFSDDGTMWSFVEADKLNSKDTAPMFPDFKTTLHIPENSVQIIKVTGSNEVPKDDSNILVETSEEKDMFYVGKWLAEDDNELGGMTFDSEGYVSFKHKGREFGGKDFDLNGQRGSSRYILENSTVPIKLDIVINNFSSGEVGRLLGIIEIKDDNSMILALNFDGTRPAEVTEENSVLLIRNSE